MLVVVKHLTQERANSDSREEKEYEGIEERGQATASNLLEQDLDIFVVALMYLLRK